MDFLKLPLNIKIKLSLARIEEWHDKWYGKVYVSFSGGKDSTVLLHLARKVNQNIKGVFVNTGLEYPEIINFVKTIQNIIWLKPIMKFKQVIEKYGYPIISKQVACAISRYRNTKSKEQKYYRLNGFPNGKRGMIPKKWQFLINAPFRISDYCCDIMKKNPLDKYAKQTDSKPMIGMMTYESNMRLRQWKEYGCNMLDLKRPKSWPIAFWTENDIWEYIKQNKLQYAKIYDTGVKRTGCIFCCFGIHLEKKPNRFDLLKKTHPQLYKYCMVRLGIKNVLKYIRENIQELRRGINENIY